MKIKTIIKVVACAALVTVMATSFTKNLPTREQKLFMQCLEHAANDADAKTIEACHAAATKLSAKRSRFTQGSVTADAPKPR